MPGSAADQQGAEQAPVHMAQRGVADAGNESQRHRVGDVGADDAMRFEARVDQHDQRRADGAGADRAQRHQHAQDQPAQHGQRRLARLGQPALQAQADRVPGLLVGHHHGGEQQGDAQREGQRAGPALGDAGEMHQGDGRQRGRDAARQQQRGDAPVHVAGLVVGPGAGRLGDGGEPQVGADGHGRVQLEHAISSGVISEPPPTPVMPTMAPTPKPLRIAIQSMGSPSGERAPGWRTEGRTLGSIYIYEKYFYVACLCLMGI